MRARKLLLMLILLVSLISCTEKVPLEPKLEELTLTFSLPAGNYETKKELKISCNQEDAEVYYTTDDSEPSQSSIKYVDPIQIDKSMTIKAIGYKKGWQTSEIKGAKYTLVTAEPVFDPPAGFYDTVLKVSISCQTLEAVIYYTLDGSEPTDSAEEYTEPIEVSTSTTIIAKASREGWSESKVSSADYDIDVKYVATPTFNPSSGIYFTDQQVTIVCSTSDAEIYYTEDGGEPTKESTKYTQPINVDRNITLKAKAYKEGFIDSEVAVSEYSLNVAAPEFSLPGGLYETPQIVELTCATPNAEIRFTVDGSEPTITSNIYTEPIDVTENLALMAKAFKEGWVESEVASVEYQFKVTKPTFNLLEGVYSSSQTVAVLCETEGVEIRYTTDGTEPTAVSPRYTSEILVTTSVTINAKGYKVGWTESDVASAEYQLKVVKPTFNPPGGLFVGSEKITIDCKTRGVEIRYSTDGSEPDMSSELYTDPVEITLSTVLKAVAFKEGWVESGVATAFYNLPMVHVQGGTFQMGNSLGESDEQPVHAITLDDFYISKHQVTQRHWKKIMGYNPSSFYYEKYDLPVEYVSWDEVIKYCNKWSISEGLTPCYSIKGDTEPSNWISGEVDCNWEANGYRLPTEAEWEYAARGGHLGVGYKYSGSDNLDEVGWYKGNSDYRTATIKTKKPNELGVFDMSGNLWEWCWDKYDSNYYQISPHYNPKGADTGDYVVRGGSWDDEEEDCRITKRDKLGRSRANPRIGFRVVRTK
ncbi:MAG: chitobiase/beta-hexosaminidase C-terminal domain-containing protein [Candidatus Cloacimonadia bacterium]